MKSKKNRLKNLTEGAGLFQKFYSQHKGLSLFITFSFLLAVFFRTYNYLGRVAVVNDHSRDALIGLYAAKHFLLPQIGAFSQAPFFFGPWWYWIMFIFYLFPFGVLTPWFFMTLLSLIFIVIIFFVGREIGGVWMGAVSVFYASISNSLIANSFGVWNPAIIPLLVLLVIFFSMRYVGGGRFINLVFAAFLSTLSFTIHFQTALVAPIVLGAILIKRPRVQNLFFLIAAGLVPLVPFLYFDLRFNWFETKRIIHYLTVDQFTYWIPNRWLTYGLIYWPKTWSTIIGANDWFARILIGLVSVFTVWRLKYLDRYKMYFFFAASFVAQVVIFRYFRGERFDYYSMFAYPSVILLTAWMTMELFKINRIVGFALFSLVAILSLQASASLLNKTVVVNYKSISILKQDLYSVYPNDKFDIYGLGGNGKNFGLPFALLVHSDNRTSMEGRKIGIYEDSSKLTWQEIKDEEISGFTLYRTTPEVVFSDVVEWWRSNPPQ